MERRASGSSPFVLARFASRPPAAMALGCLSRASEKVYLNLGAQSPARRLRSRLTSTTLHAACLLADYNRHAFEMHASCHQLRLDCFEYGPYTCLPRQGSSLRWQLQALACQTHLQPYTRQALLTASKRKASKALPRHILATGSGACAGRPRRFCAAPVGYPLQLGQLNWRLSRDPPGSSAAAPGCTRGMPSTASRRKLATLALMHSHREFRLQRSSPEPSILASPGHQIRLRLLSWALCMFAGRPMSAVRCGVWPQHPSTCTVSQCTPLHLEGLCGACQHLGNVEHAAPSRCSVALARHDAV